jgi:outer membrane protein TolC
MIRLRYIFCVGLSLQLWSHGQTLEKSSLWPEGKISSPPVMQGVAGSVEKKSSLFTKVQPMQFRKNDPKWVVSLDQVLQSVMTQYPPYLIALMERDIAAGRLQQSRGAFDLGITARGNFSPGSFYDGSVGEAFLDQPLPFWGGNVFAGYRVSSGVLADYDKNRTQTDGELRAGIKLNLLRDGVIDRRRAELWKARLDQELVDPFIQRQRLDLIRSAMRSYGNWVTQGLRYQVVEELLRLARDRDAAIHELVKKGQLAPIIQTDNERLVVSRQLSVVQARRRFESASIELSLLYRDAEDRPLILTQHHLPDAFPKVSAPSENQMNQDLRAAFEQRPELRRIALVQQKLGIDQRLAKNQLLPHLDLSASVSENLGDGPYKDRSKTETSVGLELRVPLQRREAKGRLQVAETEVQRLANDAQFARERIVAEVRDAWSAVKAGQEQMSQTLRNVELAEILENAERQRFEQGATDLLALQIREQATFDARLLEVDARAEFFRALADYDVSTARRK